MVIATGIGFIARDPEITEVNGTKVFKGSIGIDRAGNKNEEGRFDAAWIDVEAWGKEAEFIEKYFTRGSKFQFSGTLRQSSWESDGQKRYKTYIRIDSITFLPKSSGADGENAGTPQKELVGSGTSTSGFKGSDLFD